MRTIGIDLGISGQHQAVIADEQGQTMGRSYRLTTDPADLDALLDQAQAGTEASQPLRVVMEPTGLSWFPIASYYSQRGVIIHLVNVRESIVFFGPTLARPFEQSIVGVRQCRLPKRQSNH